MANETAFAAAVLRGIRAPVTHNNIAAFIGWTRAEGPKGGDAWGRNNPLNTTLRLGNQGGDSAAAMSHYNTPQAGITATTRTILQSNMRPILNALRSGNPHALPGAISASPWGTSGSLVAQTIQQTLGEHFNVPSGSSGLGGGMPGGGATGGGRGGGRQRFTSTTVPTFNQAGYQNALGRYQAGVADPGRVEDAAAPERDEGFASSLGNPNRVLFQSGALTTTPPNKQGFAGSRTIRTAQNNLQRLAGNTPLAVHPGAVGSGMLNGHYVNPLPGSTFTRTDMGVDGTGKTFRSPADSKILIADAHNAGWKGGGYIAGRILNGPRKGQVWYAAEGLTPNVRVGQTVAAGTRIARPVASPYNGIVGNYEWGWANSSGVSPMAGPNYSEGEIMPAGRDFRRFINRLGAGAGPSHS